MAARFAGPARHAGRHGGLLSSHPYIPSQVFSAADGAFLRQWQLPGGVRPGRLALTPDSAAAYVTAAGRLYKYSLPADGPPELLWSADAAGADTLAVDAAGGVWCGNTNARVVTLYAADGGARLRSEATNSTAASLAVDPTTGWLLVQSYEGTAGVYDVSGPTAALLGQVGYRPACCELANGDSSSHGPPRCALSPPLHPAPPAPHQSHPSPFCLLRALTRSLATTGVARLALPSTRRGGCM